jgi:hypothetical protein
MDERDTAGYALRPDKPDGDALRFPATSGGCVGRIAGIVMELTVKKFLTA